MYRTDNWLNEGSGWIIKFIESQYINISTYRPLSESSCIKLPTELRSPKKGLLNIKNSDQKCFIYRYVKHINPIKTHPERTAKEAKETC